MGWEENEEITFPPRKKKKKKLAIFPIDLGVNNDDGEFPEFRHGKCNNTRVTISKRLPSICQRKYFLSECSA